MRCIGIVIDMGAKGLTFSFSKKFCLPNALLLPVVNRSKKKSAQASLADFVVLPSLIRAFGGREGIRTPDPLGVNQVL